MGVIDLTNPQGKYGGSAKAVAGILQSWGQFERDRRDLALTEKFLRNLSEGQDFNTALGGVMREQNPAYSGGIGGVVQKVGSRFMPRSNFIDRLAGVSMQANAPVSALDTRKAEAGIASDEALAMYRTKQAEYRTKQADMAELAQINQTIYNIMLNTDPGPERKTQLKPWLEALDNYTRRSKGTSGAVTPPPKTVVPPPEIPVRRPVEPVAPTVTPAPLVQYDMNTGEKIVGGVRAGGSYGGPKVAPTQEGAPRTRQEFIAEVRRLNGIDEKAARAYYDQWKDKM